MNSVAIVGLVIGLTGCAGLPGQTALSTEPDIQAAAALITPKVLPQENASYFVEFRAGMSVFPGHSYFVHGVLAADGTIQEQSDPIGFYPWLGPIGGVTLGWLAIPGSTEPDPADTKTPTVETYRVQLTPQQHASLLDFIKDWRRTAGPWNLVFNNCNDFAAAAARAVGLRAPEGLSAVPPYLHIRKMRTLNAS